jgi:hypothetical protein
MQSEKRRARSMARLTQSGRCYDGGVMTIDDLRAEMQDGFNQLQAEIKADREATHKNFEDIGAEVKAEGETTRRHFNIMAETVVDSVKVVADATADHTVRINDHETRLKRLERPRGG